MKKYVKGMYLIWIDEDYVEKAINAGINTILLAWQNLYPEHGEIHDLYGTYSEVINFLEKYANDPRIDIVLVPTLNMHFKNLEKNECFYDGKKYWQRTPCPSNKLSIYNRLNPIIKMCKKYNIKNVIFDVEHYLGNTSEYGVLTIWDNKYFPKYQCKCNTCLKLLNSSENQWEKFENIFKNNLKNNNINAYGQMPYFNIWNFKKYIGEKWLFTERTYPGGKPSKSLVKEIFRKQWFKKLESKILGQKIKICAGIWAEKFSANKLLEWIYEYGKISLYDGYWLYPQARFSKYTKFKRDKNYFTLIDNPNDPTADIHFFEKLKKVNKRIDKKRKSWKFKLRNLFKI